MKEVGYNRQRVYDYAKKWAFDRNPKYYNFDPLGGDCTSFVSQCIYEGAKTMNYTQDKGWYYIDGNHKSPSWSGVEFLYNFFPSSANSLSDLIIIYLSNSKSVTTKTNATATITPLLTASFSPE